MVQSKTGSEAWLSTLTIDIQYLFRYGSQRSMNTFSERSAARYMPNTGPTVCR